MACKLVGATAIKWHKILGHAGPEAIKQLPKHVNGAELEELIDGRAPLKIECEVCLLAKHTQ
jgi:GAG-pre-integrase domain